MSEQVKILPLLPLKNSVLFPHLLMPLTVGRPGSVAAVEAAMAAEEKEIVIVAQRDSAVETPGLAELYSVGTRAVIKRMTRPAETTMELIVLGVARVNLLRLEATEPYLSVAVEALPQPDDTGPEVEALQHEVIDLAAKAIALAQPQAPQELGRLLVGTEDPLRLAYLLASLFGLEISKEQALLEAPTRADALRLTHAYLGHEIQVLELRGKIASTAQSEMGKEQREYLLRQQMRAIQQELGEKNPEQAEVELIRERLRKADLPEEVRKEAERELSRLERLPTGAPDYSVIRGYLDYVLELPWNVRTEDRLDIATAREILDTDHYDLKEVKERILEQL